ncbi:MAG: PQQ-binding-like beta-propeller repeat protein [Gemmatimonadales bacterium]|nr:PQQ-binding-like beta-propeller repeat protein [Gemmatimonadales bacterium]
MPGPVPDGVFGAFPDKGTIVRSAEFILVSGWDLFALDRKTGAIRWTFAPSSESSATSSLALAGDAVISTGGAEGYLYSIDLATGAQRWRVDLDEQLFSPVVVGGVVYLGGRRVVEPPNGLGVGHLWAVDAATGAVLWKTWVGDTARPLHNGVIARPAVSSDLVIAVGLHGTIVAADRQTGTVRWQRTFGEEGHSAGAALLGNVAITATWNGVVRGLSLASGATEWQANVGSAIVRPVTTGADQAFLIPGVIYGFGADGARLYQFGGRAKELYFSTPATYHNGIIFVAANNALAGARGGGLFALRIRD